MQTVALINKFTTYFSTESSSESAASETNSPSYFGNSKFRIKKLKRFIRNSKSLPLIIVVVLLFLVFVFVLKNIQLSPSSTSSGISSQGAEVDVKKASSSQALNKEFSFPLKDQNGKDVSKLKFIVQSVELRDEIIVKGQRGRAVDGRTFLVLNFKIVNDYDKPIQMSVRDYVRLIVNNTTEKLAPEIHNDPVEVQAISTKYTRAAFPIDKNPSSLVLQIGEVTGKKETIKLNLR